MASRGVNKVIIVGSLGQDPEVRFFPSGGSVCNVTVATSESWKDKQTGEQKEITEWHRVVFNNRLAEIASEYLKKGSKVYIEGRLQTRKWQNQQGQDQYTTEIRANEMQMLDSKPQGQQQGQNQGGYQQHQNAQSPAPRSNLTQNAPQQGGYQQGGYQQGGYQQNQGQQQGTSGMQQSQGQNYRNQNAQQHNSQQGGYQQQGGNNQNPKVNPQEPVMDFDDDIPFAPIGLAHNNALLHVM